MKNDKKTGKEIKKSLDMQELNDDELEGVAGGAMQQVYLRQNSDFENRISKRLEERMQKKKQ